MVQIIMMIINIINFLAIFYMIFKEKRSANSIIAWVLVIYIAPVIGFIAFLLVGRKMNNSNMFGIKEIEAKLFKDYIKQIHKEGYIEKDNKYLMLHRIKKKNDVNEGKWIGVGGHFEADESPEECVLREVKEETGYTLTSYRFCGLVTFVSGDGVTEYMSLFHADGFEGEQIACDEGVLDWVDINKIQDLNLWRGDKIFLKLIAEKVPFFSLKLVYDGHDGLVSAVLNGTELDLEKA